MLGAGLEPHRVHRRQGTQHVWQLTDLAVLNAPAQCPSQNRPATQAPLGAELGEYVLAEGLPGTSGAGSPRASVRIS